MIEYTLLNVLILELKIYCGPDRFYGRSKFGRNDEVKNRDPFTPVILPATVWLNDMSRNCEMHDILNSFYSAMNLKIYSFIYKYISYNNCDFNHPVAYFPFGNVCTFCMHGLTRKQPIRRLVLDGVISRSFLPD